MTMTSHNGTSTARSQSASARDAAFQEYPVMHPDMHRNLYPDMFSEAPANGAAVDPFLQDGIANDVSLYDTWSPIMTALEHAPVGKVRGTGAVIGLTLITFGIYGLVYTYATHAEIKRYSGEGVGGPLGLLLSFLAGIITAFLLPSEVSSLYTRRGLTSPVSAVTGLWCLLPFGVIVWFVKVNGALNAYWRSVGAH